MGKVQYSNFTFMSMYGYSGCIYVWLDRDNLVEFANKDACK